MGVGVQGCATGHLSPHRDSLPPQGWADTEVWGAAQQAGGRLPCGLGLEDRKARAPPGTRGQEAETPRKVPICEKEGAGAGLFWRAGQGPLGIAGSLCLPAFPSPAWEWLELILGVSECDQVCWGYVVPGQMHGVCMRVCICEGS